MTLIDDFLAKLSAPQRGELERIRQIVSSTVPDAEEAISYGMPAFKYNGKYLVGFRAYKNHVSLFPTSGPIDALRDKLEGYKLSAGTIQFTIEKPIPEETVREIVLNRAAAISGK